MCSSIRRRAARSRSASTIRLSIRRVKGGVNRIDLAQFWFEQPPGNAPPQTVERPAWWLRLDFPHGVQRRELFRQVRVALRNIGQQWQAVRRRTTFVQRARDLRRQWFIVRSGGDKEDRFRVWRIGVHGCGPVVMRYTERDQDSDENAAAHNALLLRHLFPQRPV
jgi:hypothetical protein